MVVQNLQNEQQVNQQLAIAHDEREKLNTRISELSIALSQAEREQGEHWNLINEKQEQLNLYQRQYDQKQEDFSKQYEKLYNQIGLANRKEEACRHFSKSLDNMAATDDEVTADVAKQGTLFYDRLRWQYQKEAEDLLRQKQALKAPESSDIIRMKAELQELRNEQSELSKDYQSIRAKLNSAKEQVITLTDKIKGLKALKKSKPSRTPSPENTSLLELANIPQEDWVSSIVTRHNDSADIYYGGMGNDYIWHGHIVIRNGKVVYRREPKALSTL